MDGLPNDGEYGCFFFKFYAAHMNLIYDISAFKGEIRGIDVILNIVS